MPPRPRSMVKLVWAAALVLLIAVALVVGLLIGRADEKPVKKVVLISIDTLRADHLGYAGYHRETSPAIDRLAAESLDFRNTFAQASATLSSHASIFTSLYPSVHNAEMLRATPLADGFTTLAEVFREHGFRTAAFVEGGQLATLWNLDQGFEVYDVTQIRTDEGDGWLADDLEGILARAEAWIERHRDQPFFCFIHSYVVHFPYQPRPPYDQMFVEKYEGPLHRATTYQDIDEFNRIPRRPEEPYVRYVASLYDGEIRYMDEQIGEFLQRLNELGIADETALVFTSDHGEEFAEHGKVAKHVDTLFDELLRVPLLMRIPGMSPRRIERQVRLIDLAPTLLALMNIDPGGLPFQGENLLANGPGPAADLPVFSELVYPDRYWASLRTDKHKLIAYPGQRFALFDLQTDPREQVNVFNRGRQEAVERVKEIQQIMAQNRGHVSHLASPVDLDPETEKQLRALGYMK